MYINIILHHLKLILWAALVTIFVFIVTVFLGNGGHFYHYKHSRIHTNHPTFVRESTSVPWRATNVSKTITWLAAGKAGEENVGGDK